MVTLTEETLDEKLQFLCSINFDTRSLSSAPIIMKDWAPCSNSAQCLAVNYCYPFFIFLNTPEHVDLDLNYIHSSFEKKIFAKKKRNMFCFYNLPFSIYASSFCWLKRKDLSNLAVVPLLGVQFRTIWFFQLANFGRLTEFLLPSVNFSRFAGIYFCHLAAK